MKYSANEGFNSLIGETITLFCAIYIYTGKLVFICDKFVKLENPKIVYETGSFDNKTWKDAQSLPNELYVNMAMIESFTILK